jgi:hypothetical protein
VGALDVLRPQDLGQREAGGAELARRHRANLAEMDRSLGCRACTTEIPEREPDGGEPRE